MKISDILDFVRKLGIKVDDEDISLASHAPLPDESKADFMKRCQADGGTHDQCVVRFDRARGLSQVALHTEGMAFSVGEADTFVKDMARVGLYTHPVTGQKFDITEERMDGWINAFSTMRADGVDIEVVVDHSPKAEDIVGYLKGMFKKDGVLYGIHKFTSERGRELANTVKNVSILIDHDVKYGDGKSYGEAITHSALVQQPVITGQSKFIPLSRLTGNQSVPILTRTEDSKIPKDPNKEPTMDQATLDALKEIFPNSDMTVDNALDLVKKTVAETGTEKTEIDAQIVTLTAEVETLKSNVATLTKDVVTMDPELMDMKAEILEEKIDLLAEKNIVPEAIAASMKNLILGPAGARNVMMLSKAEGQKQDPARQIIDLLLSVNPVEMGELTRAQTEKNTIALSRITPGDDDKLSDADQKTLDDTMKEGVSSRLRK